MLRHENSVAREVTAEHLEKMKADVTQELKEENRKRFQATGFL